MNSSKEELMTMDQGIDIQIKIPTHTQYLSLLGHIGEDLIAATCRSKDRNEMCSNILNIVVIEAVVNAIKHGSTSYSSSVVDVHIKIIDNELSLRVYDKGPGFDLNKISEPRFDLNNIDETGRGLFVIKSLMDSVEYKKLNGENVLEMKKSLAC
jgi:serine/threonine-protein kinase RsbW